MLIPTNEELAIARETLRLSKVKLLDSGFACKKSSVKIWQNFVDKPHAPMYNNKGAYQGV